LEFSLSVIARKEALFFSELLCKLPYQNI